MNFTNCPYCGKPYLKSSKKNICSDCRKREDSFLPKVRDYIIENPRSTLSMVSQNTGVEIKIINRFIREGLIKLSINCKMCGTRMKSDRGENLCPPCKKAMLQNLMTTSQRVNMEKEVCNDKIKEIQQKRVNDSLRKSLYGLGSSESKNKMNPLGY